MCCNGFKEQQFDRAVIHDVTQKKIVMTSKKSLETHRNDGHNAATSCYKMPWVFALLLCCFKPAEDKEEKENVPTKRHRLCVRHNFIFIFLKEFFAFIFYGKETST